MSRGGSRYGAGRPGWRRKIEQCLRLDVRRLAKGGLLRAGISTNWRWTNSYTGEETGSVGIRVEDLRIVLNYSAGGTAVTFPILLARTACHYGGTRPWFICPRCGRRCAVVAHGGRRWACRRCLNLAYSVESEDETGRLWRKQSKLEARLAGDYQRPKGMHWKTYHEILQRVADIEERKDLLLLPRLARLMDVADFLRQGERAKTSG